MKLESVKLKNFRGYKTETIIPISDLTAFIGKNEAGKGKGRGTPMKICVA